MQKVRGMGWDGEQHGGNGEGMGKGHAGTDGDGTGLAGWGRDGDDFHPRADRGPALANWTHDRCFQHEQPMLPVPRLQVQAYRTLQQHTQLCCRPTGKAVPPSRVPPDVTT